jgi:prevent-host-death family protein
MTTLKIPVSEFKAKCTKVLRDVAASKQRVEVTNHGEVVAVILPPKPEAKPDPKAFLGSLRGTASFVGDIVSPLGEKDWKACR